MINFIARLFRKPDPVLKLFEDIATEKWRIIHDSDFFWENTYYGDRYFVERRRLGVWQRVEYLRPSYTPPGWPTERLALEELAQVRKAKDRCVTITEVED